MVYNKVWSFILLISFTLLNSAGIRGNGIGGHFSLAGGSGSSSSLLNGSMLLTNNAGPTFNNVVVTITLPEDIEYVRTSAVTDGQVSVAGNVLTWITGENNIKTYAFTLRAKNPGEYSLIAYVTDNQGTLHPYVSDTATLQFPQINNQAYAIAKNGTLSLNVQDLLVINPPTTTTVTHVLIQPTAQYGTVAPLTNTQSPFALIYTPNTGFVGYDYFTIQALDANGCAALGSVFVAVGVEGDAATNYPEFLRQTYNPVPLEQGPVAMNVTYTIDVGQSINDDLRFYVDLSRATAPITYALPPFVSSTGAVITLTDGFNFGYNGASQAGTDIFNYVVTDTNGHVSTGTITVNVQAT